MKKNIKFIPTGMDVKDHYDLSIPVPAKQNIPEWYKKSSMYENGDILSADLGTNLTFKACTPFLETFTSGYLITTHQDILVRHIQSDTGEVVPRFSWTTSNSPLIYRSEKTDFPHPEQCFPISLAWIFGFGFRLPKGYSAIFTHPFNRFDLPFTTATGIVDEGIDWAGKIPFWINKNFEGIIPMNTPFAQIIPFKRDDWKSTLATELEEEAYKNMKNKTRFANGFYKKFINIKKTFE